MAKEKGSKVFRDRGETQLRITYEDARSGEGKVLDVRTFWLLPSEKKFVPTRKGIQMKHDEILPFVADCLVLVFNSGAEKAIEELRDLVAINHLPKKVQPPAAKKSKKKAKTGVKK